MRTSPGGQTEVTGEGKEQCGRKEGDRGRRKTYKNIVCNTTVREGRRQKRRRSRKMKIIYIHKKRGQEGKTWKLRHTQRKSITPTLEETYRETREDETEGHGGVEGRVTDRQTDRQIDVRGYNDIYLPVTLKYTLGFFRVTFHSFSALPNRQNITTGLVER